MMETEKQTFLIEISELKLKRNNAMFEIIKELIKLNIVNIARYGRIHSTIIPISDTGITFGGVTYAINDDTIENIAVFFKEEGFETILANRTLTINW